MKHIVTFLLLMLLTVLMVDGFIGLVLWLA